MLDHIDVAIIRYLARTGAVRNTNQIADTLKINWNTAYKHLVKLNQYGYLIKKREGDSWYWRIIKL